MSGLGGGGETVWTVAVVAADLAVPTLVTVKVSTGRLSGGSSIPTYSIFRSGWLAAWLAPGTAASNRTSATTAMLMWPRVNEIMIPLPRVRAPCPRRRAPVYAADQERSARAARRRVY